MTTHALGNCRFELLTDQRRFLGLGRVWIGDTLVRSGRLPLSPFSQSFSGLELAALELLGVDEQPDELRLRTRARFVPMPTKVMRDHSFDPIHDTGDWDQPPAAGEGELDLVIRPAADTFGGVACHGFSYQYAYRSQNVALYWMLDRGSWELDGDILGATAVSQSSCSDPFATFAADTRWSTEGLIHWDPDMPNPVMTHNLPRWASHQAFDFQHKDGRTLLGIFGQVGLIRSLLKREPGKPELKVFDKHIFDQALGFETVPKAILLAEGTRSETGQRNLWTWTIDTVHDRARAEFGLVEEPVLPRIAQNYWVNFTVDSYRRDLLPAAKAIGIRQIFVDNLKKSAMTDRTPFPGKFNWNMCCGHEYEIAPELGGEKAVKRFVEDCAAEGIQVMSWTNNDQALSSPINESERDDKAWFVRLEDTRLKFGGAYAAVFSVLDFSSEGAFRYFVDSHVKIFEETGLGGYLFDSFYNLGFMPVSYVNARPHTMWRQCLQAFKELQDAGVHFLIESLGPFGQPQHGCPRSYSVDNAWVVYKIGLGNDYTTVPSGQTYDDPRAGQAAALFRLLAHQCCPVFPLFKDGQRVDTQWTDAHKQALADYHAAMPAMHRRYLQEDGRTVIWHDRDGATATIWCLEDTAAALTGPVTDITTGEALPASTSCALQAGHVYQLTGAPLPATL